MSDDEARSDIPAALRAGTGPRHAAPRKPLLTRLHVPAGKAIALAAMPTAVLMGMGFTPTLARAEDHAASNSQQAEEYKKCVAALEGDDASASPSPTPSASASASPGDSGKESKESKDDSAGKSDSPSSDSGSDDKGEPRPSPSPSASTGDAASGESSPSPSPSASASSGSEKADGGGLLESIGNTIGDLLTGGSSSDDAKSASPSPSPSASASTDGASEAGSGSGSAAKEKSPEASSSPKASASAPAAEDGDKKAGEDTEKADDEDKASASPSPSPNASTDAGDCEVSTDAVADGRDNKILLPENPWILQASGLTLDGADYQGVVEVTTSSGVKKKVLKYVISKSTKIVDLHQIVNDKNSGKTYHVQSAKGKESTITDGATTMYTESISGNLFGLIPVTFSPDNPPPLNLPWIYFSNVKVVQAGQFGGTLHIPGMHQSIT
ncbi:hypothetical protein [Streptomyces acidiscabies]|uniref:hypothetical protein n=1 Tax=Streptomyces acidiscabies TaxID=42234 RepID=UPI000951DD32|nr:hypothetical protein [Streptomyces acidiscabies]